MGNKKCFISQQKKIYEKYAKATRREEGQRKSHKEIAFSGWLMATKNGTTRK